MEQVSQITNEYWFTEANTFIRKNIASNNFLNDTLKEKLAMLHSQLTLNNSVEIFNQANQVIIRNHKDNFSKYNGWLGNSILIIIIFMSIMNGIGYVPKYRAYYDNYIKRFLEFLLFIVSFFFVVYIMALIVIFIDL